MEQLVFLMGVTSAAPEPRWQLHPLSMALFSNLGPTKLSLNSAALGCPSFSFHSEWTSFCKYWFIRFSAFTSIFSGGSCTWPFHRWHTKIYADKKSFSQADLIISLLTPNSPYLFSAATLWIMFSVSILCHSPSNGKNQVLQSLSRFFSWNIVVLLS